ncbi:hypothetical protein [Candidatus Avelusimicrobium fimicolum]
MNNFNEQIKKALAEQSKGAIELSRIISKNIMNASINETNI